MAKNDYRKGCNQGLTLPITNIQKFSVNDGPGIRTTVFIKGCPLNCFWCHNPETKSTKNSLMYSQNECISCFACKNICQNDVHSFSPTHKIDFAKCTACFDCTRVCVTKALKSESTDMELSDIISDVMKDEAFYGDDGGITLSGGEPFLHPKEAICLLQSAKKMGITTAVETCGFFPSEYIKAACSCTDLFLYDIKDTVLERHKLNTGVSNDLIISNLKAIDQTGSKTIMRCIMLNGINIDDEHLNGIATLFSSLNNCLGVEILPYHMLGGAKNIMLGQPDPTNKKYIPDKGLLEEIKSKLAFQKVKLI